MSEVKVVVCGNGINPVRENIKALCIEEEIRADERNKVLDEVLRKHNNCNTDLCEYINTNISCCECIVRKLKEQNK